MDDLDLQQKNNNKLESSRNVGETNESTPRNGEFKFGRGAFEVARKKKIREEKTHKKELHKEDIRKEQLRKEELRKVELRKEELRKKEAPKDQASDEFELSAPAKTDYDVNRFINSLDSFNEKDIPMTERAVKREAELRKLRTVRYAGLGICFTVIAVCLVFLAGNLISKYQGRVFYDKYKDDFFDGFNFENGEIAVAENTYGSLPFLKSDRIDSILYDSTTVGTPGFGDSSSPSVNLELERMRAKLQSYLSINPDLYGYISIPGTNISYVIVQSPEYTGGNDYYLTHRWDGKFLVSGSIFADARNSKTVMNNYNLVIYGHNMVDGTMFHDIEKFHDEKLFDETSVYIYTLDGVYIYKPISFYSTSIDFDYIKTYFSTPSAFTGWADEITSKSFHPTSYTYTANDRILTLSTCVNGMNGWRYTLQCVLTQVISD